jgi:transposase
VVVERLPAARAAELGRVCCRCPVCLDAISATAAATGAHSETGQTEPVASARDPDPKLRIYLVADNLFTHKTAAIRDWAAESNVELVFTPTYASFLNRIECPFWAIGEFVINNATTPTGTRWRRRMADHIRYRNGPHRDHRLIKAERRLLVAA